MTEISEKTLLQSYRVTSMHSVTPFSEIYDHKQLFGKYAFTFWSSLLHRWNELASCGILGGLGLWDSSISTILNVFNGF